MAKAPRLSTLDGFHQDSRAGAAKATGELARDHAHEQPRLVQNLFSNKQKSRVGKHNARARERERERERGASQTSLCVKLQKLRGALRRRGRRSPRGRRRSARRRRSTCAQHAQVCAPSGNRIHVSQGRHARLHERAASTVKRADLDRTVFSLKSPSDQREQSVPPRWASKKRV